MNALYLYIIFLGTCNKYITDVIKIDSPTFGQK